MSGIVDATKQSDMLDSLNAGLTLSQLRTLVNSLINLHGPDSAIEANVSDVYITTYRAAHDKAEIAGEIRRLVSLEDQYQRRSEQLDKELKIVHRDLRILNSTDISDLVNDLLDDAFETTVDWRPIIYETYSTICRDVEEIAEFIEMLKAAEHKRIILEKFVDNVATIKAERNQASHSAIELRLKVAKSVNAEVQEVLENIEHVNSELRNIAEQLVELHNEANVR